MSSRLTAPILTSRIVVVSDFNCPYCFTLNEWLHELGVSDRCRWLGIEHRPDLPRDGANLEVDARQLGFEVDDVMRRAPGLGVQRPPLWSNSRTALLLQNAVEVDAPEDAAPLRLRLFRRYWVEGQVLSDPATLAAELAARPDLDLAAEEAELTRLTDWWRERVDRIPVMIAPTGIAHLGLQDRDTVRRFVQSAIADAQPGPGCR